MTDLFSSPFLCLLVVTLAILPLPVMGVSNDWDYLHMQIAIAAFFVIALVASVTWFALSVSKKVLYPIVLSYIKFVYASFLKPLNLPADHTQQHALESFYKTQVDPVNIISGPCYTVMLTG